ncbi:DUF805 domain-containing protein [Rhizobacter sp. J219]|uniref:DUF805 domain-containing protein n=1 Tax=Rhizobacter sp. J219 TaxID=2898430 RepID=UPI002150BEBB|nr:DUF805 domain-containing protein [Rhizobacter sp. J219]MCR5884355.1 DUF805 domain-containing protein [Rhizobacter sp. J219]
MSAVNNPFNPPRAEVSDVHPASTEVGALKYWSAKGRIGRLRYIAWTMGASILMAIVMGVLMAILIPTMGETGATIAMLVGYVPMLVFIVFALIQRTHDMGWSGWMCLLAFIPLVGLIWVFKAGTPGANAYGPPPPPNSTGVNILAWMLPVIFVIGILAAIALPAYQGYTERAKAAQQQ